MKKAVICTLLILFTFTSFLVPRNVSAQDDTMRFFFRDMLYGAGIGAFLGGLLLLTTDEKNDHWDYVAFGALIGSVGGLAYSVSSSTHALLEIDNKTVTVGLPTLQTAYASQHGHKGFVTELIKFRY